MTTKLCNVEGGAVLVYTNTDGEQELAIPEGTLFTYAPEAAETFDSQTDGWPVVE